MAIRFRLSTVLNLTVLLYCLLWIYQLDGGGLVLKGMGGWILAAIVFYLLLLLVTFLFGIPGELQRKLSATEKSSSKNAEPE